MVRRETRLSCPVCSYILQNKQKREPVSLTEQVESGQAKEPEQKRSLSASGVGAAADFQSASTKAGNKPDGNTGIDTPPPSTIPAVENLFMEAANSLASPVLLL